MTRKQLKAVLLIYGLVMIWLLLGQRIGQENESVLQLQPLRTIFRFLWVLTNSADSALRFHAWANLLGNVFLFVPLGTLVPQIWEKPRNLLRHILLMSAIIAAVELLQLATGLGTCDVDDLILNLLGTELGYVVFMGYSRWHNKRHA